MLQVAEVLQPFVEAPEDHFLQPNEATYKVCAEATKTLFDLNKEAQGDEVVGGPLTELLVDGFDTEQVWQQLELENQPVLEHLDNRVTEIVEGGGDDEDEDEDEGDENEGYEGDEGDELGGMGQDGDDFDEEAYLEELAGLGMEGFEGDFGEGDDLDDMPDDLDDMDFEELKAQILADRKGGGSVAKKEAEGAKKTKSKGRKLARDQSRGGGVLQLESESDEEEEEGGDNEDLDDDGEEEDELGGRVPKGGKAGAAGGDDVDFFDMEEFEKMGDEDPLEGGEDDEDDEGDELGGEDIGYDDFFDAAPDGLMEKNKGEQDADDSDVEDAAMSMFERQNGDMRRQIKQLEEEMIKPRDWELTGEVDKKTRPKESLLATDLDIDYATRPAEPVTEESTKAVEEIIRQRIIDEAFDDPERKKEPKKRRTRDIEEVSTEKSKEGLAEVYEKEFLEMAKGEDEPTAAQEKLNAEHAEIAQLFAQLSYKLDALSDFQFAPKPPTEEVTVVSTAPAISMEEVIPMGVSSSSGTLIAPEEQYKAKNKGAPVGEDEVTQGERKSKRARKKKVRKRKNAALDKYGGAKRAEAKDIKSALNKRNVKTGVNTDSTKYSTSTEMFQQLTDKQGATADNPFARSSKKAKKAGAKEGKVLGPASVEDPSRRFKL